MKNKKNTVYEIFSSVATKYDLMNNIMSLGIHDIWKNHFVNKILSHEKMCMIDVACGTGDIIHKMQNKFYNNSFIIGCDPNIQMLKICKEKMLNRGSQIDLICCEGEKMPFKINTFTTYTISFGIRNVYNITKTLEEAYRIIKPGGQLLCMEFGVPENVIIANLYDLYSRFIPIVGGMVTDNKEAYQYLIDSIRNFPHKEVFKGMIMSAGFEDVKIYPLSGGIVNIFIAWKPDTL
ncbi:bifunctional demethylmenaquinone methyltransferase/2-methoxy-6-polyprenyl-1,4-benzoquinol methylase UbiE [Anaplasmataceae bacterium AB001_6]|nr:bifunctional demethylmenaquinone methyltransferase/2-methoxy-6-polyprenyl-1,4-benzoquinol methylase UbiE [Anaplasmataceae bacterium AB001_6]